MKTTIKYFSKIVLLVSFLLLFLSACTPPEPRMFGIPQSQWQQLTPAQQQAVIHGYNERERIKTVNQPINDAIGSASAILRQDQWYRHNKNWSAPPPTSSTGF